VAEIDRNVKSLSFKQSAYSALMVVGIGMLLHVVPLSELKYIMKLQLHMLMPMT
jgi:hypothetical protein